jgi:hypothetical protein
MSPQASFFSRYFDVWCIGKIEAIDDLLLGSIRQALTQLDDYLFALIFAPVASITNA